MGGKVIHLKPEIHDKLRDHCKKIDAPMSKFVESLIYKAIENNKSDNMQRVEKKVLPKIPKSDIGNDLWSEPPFWDKDANSKP